MPDFKTRIRPHRHKEILFKYLAFGGDTNIPCVFAMVRRLYPEKIP